MRMVDPLKKYLIENEYHMTILACYIEKTDHLMTDLGVAI